MKEGRQCVRKALDCCIVFSPSAHKSEDWSCPRLNTSSGDRYSTWMMMRKRRKRKKQENQDEKWKKEKEKKSEK
jgi:hypothetical protein